MRKPALPLSRKGCSRKRKQEGATLSVSLAQMWAAADHPPSLPQLPFSFPLRGISPVIGCTSSPSLEDWSDINTALPAPQHEHVRFSRAGGLAWQWYPLAFCCSVSWLLILGKGANERGRAGTASLLPGCHPEDSPRLRPDPAERATWRAGAACRVSNPPE